MERALLDAGYLLVKPSKSGCRTVYVDVSSLEILPGHITSQDLAMLDKKAFEPFAPFFLRTCPGNVMTVTPKLPGFHACSLFRPESHRSGYMLSLQIVKIASAASPPGAAGPDEGPECAGIAWVFSLFDATDVRLESPLHMETSLDLDVPSKLIMSMLVRHGALSDKSRISVPEVMGIHSQLVHDKLFSAWRQGFPLFVFSTPATVGRAPQGLLTPTPSPVQAAQHLGSYRLMDSPASPSLKRRLEVDADSALALFHWPFWLLTQ